MVIGVEPRYHLCRSASSHRSQQKVLASATTLPTKRRVDSSAIVTPMLTETMRGAPRLSLQMLAKDADAPQASTPGTLESARRYVGQIARRARRVIVESISVVGVTIIRTAVFKVGSSRITGFGGIMAHGRTMSRSFGPGGKSEGAVERATPCPDVMPCLFSRPPVTYFIFVTHSLCRAE